MRETRTKTEEGLQYFSHQGDGRFRVKTYKKILWSDMIVNAHSLL
nr:MAG TPA: hypothetical protein [Caudoviricetes sp.]